MIISSFNCGWKAELVNGSVLHEVERVPGEELLWMLIAQLADETQVAITANIMPHTLVMLRRVPLFSTLWLPIHPGNGVA